MSTLLPPLIYMVSELMHGVSRLGLGGVCVVA